MVAMLGQNGRPDHAVVNAYRPALHPTGRHGCAVDPECSLDCIATRSPAHEARRVHAPDNDLFDLGCDLVAAAAGIRRAAGSPAAARAVPAVLGCIEAAMRELAHATAELESTTARTRSRTSDSKSERMRRGYANLQQSLEDAERAAAAARPLAGRVLAITAR